MFLDRNLQILQERLPVLCEIDIVEEQEKAVDVVHAMVIGYGLEHWTFSDQSKMVDLNRELFAKIFSLTDLKEMTYKSHDKRSTTRRTLIELSNAILQSYDSYLIWGDHYYIKEFAIKYGLTEMDINTLADHQGVSLEELDDILKNENVIVTNNLYGTISQYFDTDKLLVELLERNIDTEGYTLAEYIIKDYHDICMLAPNKIVEFIGSKTDEVIESDVLDLDL